jgi:hypothetical protein
VLIERDQQGEFVALIGTVAEVLVHRACVDDAPSAEKQPGLVRVVAVASPVETREIDATPITRGHRVGVPPLLRDMRRDEQVVAQQERVVFDIAQRLVRGVGEEESAARPACPSGSPPRTACRSTAAAGSAARARVGTSPRPRARTTKAPCRCCPSGCARGERQQRAEAHPPREHLGVPSSMNPPMSGPRRAGPTSPRLSVIGIDVSTWGQFDVLSPVQVAP